MRAETQKQQTAADSRIKDLRDLCEVLIEETIFQDWTFVVHVKSLRCLKQVSLVQRLPSSRKSTAEDARGNTVGTTEEWRSRDDITVALYVRSTQCLVLFEEYTRPVNYYP